MDLEAKEQVAEINRLKDLIINALVGAKAHPRELSMALILIAIEAHRRSTTMNDKQIRKHLAEMAVWLTRNGTMIRKVEIN